jgi:hypothetical protein
MGPRPREMLSGRKVHVSIERDLAIASIVGANRFSVAEPMQPLGNLERQPVIREEPRLCGPCGRLLESLDESAAERGRQWEQDQGSHDQQDPATPPSTRGGRRGGHVRARRDLSCARVHDLLARC